MYNLKQELLEMIAEHKKYYCTDYEQIAATLIEDADAATEQAYDVGRYEALLEVVRMIDKEMKRCAEEDIKYTTSKDNCIPLSEWLKR